MDCLHRVKKTSFLKCGVCCCLRLHRVKFTMIPTLSRAASLHPFQDPSIYEAYRWITQESRSIEQQSTVQSSDKPPHLVTTDCSLLEAQQFITSQYMSHISDCYCTTIDYKIKWRRSNVNSKPSRQNSCLHLGEVKMQPPIKFMARLLKNVVRLDFVLIILIPRASWILKCESIDGRGSVLKMNMQ